jgi:hypothetical protein
MILVFQQHFFKYLLMVELTYTNSGPLSERKVDKMVSLLLLFLTEPFGVKPLRFGVIFRVMVKSNRRYDDPCSCVQNNVCFWNFIWLRTLAVYCWKWWIFSESFWNRSICLIWDTCLHIWLCHLLSIVVKVIGELVINVTHTPLDLLSVSMCLTFVNSYVYSSALRSCYLPFQHTSSMRLAQALS